MALDLHFDECANARVIAGVRPRGVALTTAAEQGLLGASDEKHLDRAVKFGRVIVTSDPAFLIPVKARLEAGMTFPGLIFIANQGSIGATIAALELYATVREPAAMVNRIEWD